MFKTSFCLCLCFSDSEKRNENELNNALKREFYPFSKALENEIDFPRYLQFSGLQSNDEAIL